MLRLFYLRIWRRLRFVEDKVRQAKPCDIKLGNREPEGFLRWRWRRKLLLLWFHWLCCRRDALLTLSLWLVWDDLRKAKPSHVELRDCELGHHPWRLLLRHWLVRDLLHRVLSRGLLDLREHD